MEIKKQIYILGILIILLPSCNDLTDLSELNKNPNAFEEVIPDYMFTNSQMEGASYNFTNGSDGQHYILAQAMQQFATHSEVRGTGDKYFNESMAKNH